MCVQRKAMLSHAADNEARTIAGLVQSQDLRRVDQAIVQVRDQEGNVVTQGVTNQAGEFSVIGPAGGDLFGQRRPRRPISSEYRGGEDRYGTRQAPVTLTPGS